MDDIGRRSLIFLSIFGDGKVQFFIVEKIENIFNISIGVGGRYLLCFLFLTVHYITLIIVGKLDS